MLRLYRMASIIQLHGSKRCVLSLLFLEGNRMAPDNHDHGNTLSWERVHLSGGYYSHESLFRMPVPGGWLVQTRGSIYKDGVTLQGAGLGLTFMPDPSHSWALPK